MRDRIELLADCATWYSGGTPKTSVDEFWGGDIPWITSGSLTEFRLRDSERRLTSLGVKNGSRLVPTGSTLFVVRGMSLNSEFRVGISQRELAFGQDCKALVPKEWILPEYLAYSVAGRTREVLSMVDQAAHGTGRLPTDLIGSLGIRIVSLNHQQKIVDVLSAFDDLIENNRRRIEILEEMARLLYREWFVHFRFPGHEDVEMVDSELGPIPEGWEILNLFELSQIGFGFSFKSKQFGTNGPFPIVRIRDIPKGETATFTCEPSAERYEIHDGDTLIGMDGDFHMCRWSAGLAYLNQRVCRVRATGLLGQMALHLALERPILRFNQTIIGTTVAHLGKRHLEEIFLAVPPSDISEMLNGRLQTLMDLEINLCKQNRVLREARDLLLPRLVSGELDVSEFDLDGIMA